MESSQSKSTQTLSDAASRTDLDDLCKCLILEKKLVEGRKYLVRKSKRNAQYWDFYIEYLEDGKLRAECKFFDKTFVVDGNLNGSKNVMNHAGKCVANLANKEKSKGKQSGLFF